MRSLFGVAGKVAPGELASMSDRFATDGMETEVVSIPGLELLLVGRSANELSESHQELAGVHAIAVGRPLHPKLTGIPDTLLDALGEYRAGGPRLTGSWLGEFNLLLADGPRRVLGLETDCLGLRPLFMREDGSRVVFGSEAWPLVEAGLVPPAIDLDAFASWILLEHPLNGRSLFSGLLRMPPGRARIDLDSGRVEVDGDSWPDADLVADPRGLVHDIAASVDELLSRVVRDEDRIGSFLSGGYDSRYVACRLTALGHPPDDAVLVDAGAGDLVPGREVASRLGIPLTVVEIDGSLVDAFGDPWFFAPHGFPIRRFYTSLAVEGLAEVPPMVDGLLGDDGVRGWIYEQVVRSRSPDASELSVGLLDAHASLRPDILFGDTQALKLRQLVLREIEQFRPQVETEARRAWLWVLLHRTRDFHAKNHLQVLDQTETYHPFVNPTLIQTRMSHRADLFDDGLYETMLQANCEILGGIPHSDSIPRPNVAHGRFSRVFQRRVPAILGMLAADGRRMGLSRAHTASRLAAYAAGRRDQRYIVRPLDRIRTLRERLAGIGEELPWEDVWARST
jgi:hypothetical protein